MGIMRSIFHPHRKSKSRSSMPEIASPTLSSAPSTPTTPSTPPRQQLKKVFDKFDSNGDGKISCSELAAVFESLGHPPTEDELKKMMEEADADGDGYISLEEFTELNTKKVDAVSALEDLRFAFAVFDADHNGSISPDELAAVLRSLGECATVAQCKKMIEGVDQDGDGLVTFEDFKAMMMGS